MKLEATVTAYVLIPEEAVAKGFNLFGIGSSHGARLTWKTSTETVFGPDMFIPDPNLLRYASLAEPAGQEVLDFIAECRRNFLEHPELRRFHAWVVTELYASVEFPRGMRFHNISGVEDPNPKASFCFWTARNV